MQGVGIHQEELKEKHTADFSKAFKEAFLLLLNVINRVYVNKPANQVAKSTKRWKKMIREAPVTDKSDDGKSQKNTKTGAEGSVTVLLRPNKNEAKG